MNFYISDLEKEWMEKGLDGMTPYSRNSLIIQVASNSGMPDYNEVTDEFLLNHHKEIKVELFKNKCEEEIIEGFTATNGHVYRTNRDDQINMLGQKDELLLDESVEVVYWKTEDVGYIAHTVEEWMAIYNEAFKHKKEKLFKYDSLKGNILKATSEEELVAIKWE